MIIGCGHGDLCWWAIDDVGHVPLLSGRHRASRTIGLGRYGVKRRRPEDDAGHRAAKMVALEGESSLQGAERRTPPGSLDVGRALPSIVAEGLWPPLPTDVL